MNLNITEFFNGNIKFDCNKSGDTNITFNSKATPYDVYSKQGWINVCLSNNTNN